MHFTISSDLRPPEAVITVAGELDVFTSRKLRDHLQDAVDHRCRHILLELGNISFADASAVRVLTRFRKQVAELDGSLQLTAWSPQVERLCRLVGIDRALMLTDAVPA